MILFMVMMWLVVVMMMTFLTMMMVIIIVIVDNDDDVDDGVGGNANWVILGRSRRPARRLVRAAGIRIMRFKS